MLSFKIVKMAKDLMGKKCARKIVNCYWMFAALDEAKDFKRSRPQRPSKARPRASIPVWGQRSRNWSDSKWEAAKNSTCENEAERSSAKTFNKESSGVWLILWARRWNNTPKGFEFQPCDVLLHCVLSNQRNVQILKVRHKLLKTFVSGLSLQFLPSTTPLLRKAWYSG